ncbi:MAG: PQQ-binding-like beta-propeller repeat protein [Planctomycetales bacterium]|nr:PQQ-binding-like beta-propeller repeat protein [Planctomycetales bacterium]
MQKQATQFIALLESQQLLSPDVLDELRRQVADSRTRLTAELLAKLLVDNGHLTKFQATKLIAEIREPLEEPEEEEELGFAEESSLPTHDKSTGKGSSSDSPLAEMLFDEEEEPAELKVGELAEVTAEVVEVPPPAAAQALPTAELSDEALLPPVSRRLPPKKKANPYDSFRILGVGLILALFLIAGFFLVNFFWRGNADERLGRADDAYEQRSYETAATMYQEFTEIFPANDQASYAKVRAALAAIRKDVEGVPDPKLGLDTALEQLPPIASESALAEQQSDLAGALIALASKFNDRADAAETTAERKSLMAAMEQLLALINDPRYVGAQQRNQQAPTLNRMQEDRQRILRDIQRDEELAAALSQIDKKLTDRDTLAAYDIRKQLVNRYPLLEADSGLQERVRRATEVQRELVEAASLNVQLSDQPLSAPETRSFVLAHRTGKAATSLAGEVLFVKVKGAVYGLDGESGEVLWRQFVGRDFHSEPLRLGQGASSDVIICQAEKGRLARLAGKTGGTLWSADVGQPLRMPAVDDQDLLLATLDGTLASLDIGAGQTKWATKLPQSLPCAAGVPADKPHLYAVAEHSNLYVLARADGSCQEVVYLGHRPGAIVVPPILLLGQLFVFENINSSLAKIRVFSTTGKGLGLSETQIPITMQGNIVVSPQIDGRRLIVQSDLGQIEVLDVEPTAESRKVSSIAGIPNNLFEPKLSWLTTDSNRLWVSDSRFTRLDLQVASGKLSRVWIKNDGDRFTGPPQKHGETIVHSRRLRGNQGVRVSAVEAESGNPLWETDLGVPVTLLAAGDTGLDVVNTSAMLFSVDKTALRTEADADPGQGKPSLSFTDPVWLSDGRAVLWNQSRANQLAVYSPTGQKLHLLAAALGTASPSCAAVAVGDHLALGLDNGQLVMIDPSNGSLAATPYQPAIEPGRKVRWNTPAYLPQGQALIVASDLNKLVRLSIGPELRSLREVDLESPLVGPLLPLGEQVCGVESARVGDSLLIFDATTLAQVANLLLPGRLIAGPFPQTFGCILQTESQLLAFSSQGKRLWAVDFPNSQLVAAPQEMSGKLILATRGGNVWTLDADSGAVLGQTDVGQALSAAPLVLPAGLMLGSDEGAVLALPVPSGAAPDSKSGGGQ